MPETDPIPVIDVFAGCGGLSEGFYSRVDPNGQRIFDVALAFESEEPAYQSHLIRAFFHQFPVGDAPAAYYRFLRGEVDREELFDLFPTQAKKALASVKHWTLGGESQHELHNLIEERVADRQDWILIGGPPCQAYSVAGRSRRGGKNGEVRDRAGRHLLYQEYLKILTEHWPAVFVMENVPGILNAKVDGKPMWGMILGDLVNPAEAVEREELHVREVNRKHDAYRLFSLVVPSQGNDIWGYPEIDKQDFVVKCEKFGVPQARHRVFVVGVREDISHEPEPLEQFSFATNVGDALDGLPPVRSGLSRGEDSNTRWGEVVRSALNAHWWEGFDDEYGVRSEMEKILRKLNPHRKAGRGSQFVRRSKMRQPKLTQKIGWSISDDRIGGVPNHRSRKHMPEDIHRYLFAACFSKVSPDPLRLSHFPIGLLPEHRNVASADARKLAHSNFSDRFAVQRSDQPSRTIVSHISKDGHYYIHPDPAQCRSLTVREAARLQTFPDNFFFSGNRTEQYQQVGNAVPPFLSWQIAGRIADVLA